MATETATPADADLSQAFLDASRALVGIAIYSVATSPVELTVAQFRVLAILSTTPSCTVGAVAARLGVNQSNATRHCDRLQRLGLVERSRSARDGRVVLVRLTPRGQDVVDDVTAVRRTQIEQVLESMDEPLRRSVLAAVRSFNDAAGRLTEHPWLSAAW